MKVETSEIGLTPDRINQNEFSSYLELVAAKRKRNQEWLEQSGLLSVSKLRDVKPKQGEKKGISADKSKQIKTVEVIRRKSNRLAGVRAVHMYVEDERGGKFQIAGASPLDGSDSVEGVTRKQTLTYKNRLNDGEDISLTQAVTFCDKKWCKDSSVSDAEKLFVECLKPLVTRFCPEVRETSLIPEEVKIPKLSELDAIDVAVVCHPSTESLILGAGDKSGHIGLWNVDGQAENTNGNFALFYVHNSPVSCLEWVGSGSGLLSASYDGTIRWMDVETKKFSQLFATFGSSHQFSTSLGYGMEDGNKSWIQFCCLDTRYGSEKCFFLSNSIGDSFHVDLRDNAIISFHEKLSEKKINTLRYVCKHSPRQNFLRFH
jgi:WD40 repeat protein